MLLHQLCILTGATLSFALPNTSPSYESLTQVNTFDNLQGVPGSGVNEVNGNGIAYNLNYAGFSLVATTSPNAVPVGLVPNTAPNDIAFGPADPVTLQSGQGGSALITVDYQGSQIAFFDLDYFYFGCGLAAGVAVAGVDASCNITVTGVGPPPASKQIAKQSFAFVAQSAQQQMNFADLIGFKGLYTAKFTVTNAVAAGTAVTVGVVDTVKNTIYSTNLIPGSP